MDAEQKLIDALVGRAIQDANRFREQYPAVAPTELWIENCYTAALPLAKADSGVDPGPDPHPYLFEAYRRTIRQRIGERPDLEPTTSATTR